MNQPRLWCMALVTAAVAWPVTVYAQTSIPSRAPAVTKAKPEAQRIFKTPEQAAAELANAIRSNDLTHIHSVLGPGSSKVIRSGDPVQDTAGRKRFLEAYETSVKIERSGDARVTLLIGSGEFPFPFPLVKLATGWKFDSKAGAEEIVNRRIGRNERSAIQVCLAYVDAQREYATKDRDTDGLLEYAHKFISTPGELVYTRQGAGLRQPRAVPRLLLQNSHWTRRGQPGRCLQLHRARQDDRRLRAGGISRAVGGLRRYDLYLQSPRRGV